MKKYFWARPMYLPYVHEPLSDNVLVEFEQKIGYRLPSGLVELLKIQNGGLVRYGTSPKHPPSRLYGIGDTYPKLHFLEEELGEEAADYFGFPLRSLLVFNGDGHHYDCLDYRQHADCPQVIQINIDTNRQTLLADNVEQFLQDLKLDTEGIWAVQSEKPLIEVVSEFKRAGVEFETPPPGTHYPLYFGKLGEYQLCLSPNQVAFAVTSNGKKLFNRAKNYTCDIALRYPEINAGYSLLLAYDEDLIPLLNARLGGEFNIVRLAELLDNCL